MRVALSALRTQARTRYPLSSSRPYHPAADEAGRAGNRDRAALLYWCHSGVDPIRS